MSSSPIASSSNRLWFDPDQEEQKKKIKDILKQYENLCLPSSSTHTDAQKNRKFATLPPEQTVRITAFPSANSGSIAYFQTYSQTYLEQVNLRFDKALKLLANYQFQEAINQLKNLHYNYPNNPLHPLTLLTLSKALFIWGMQEKELAEFETSLNLKPDPQCYLNKFIEAEHCIGSIGHELPASSKILCQKLKAEILFANHKLTEALEVWQQIERSLNTKIFHQEQIAYCLARIADCHSAKNENAAAEALYECALSIDPSIYEVVNGWIAFLLKQKNYENAFFFVDSLIGQKLKSALWIQDEEISVIYFLKAKIYALWDQPKNSLESLKEVPHKHPSSISWIKALTKVLPDESPVQESIPPSVESQAALALIMLSQS